MRAQAAWNVITHIARTRAADEQLGALAHLPRRLVGERDRQDLVGLGRVGGDQVGDPVRQHAGLARAGAGEDQQRPLAVGDRLALGVVQSGQRVVESLSSALASLDGSTVAARGGRSMLGAPGERSGRATIRAACAAVGTARPVRVDRARRDRGRTPPRLPLGRAARQPGSRPASRRRAPREEPAPRSGSTLDAINFGSGWFPTLRKRAGPLRLRHDRGRPARPRSSATGPWTRRRADRARCGRPRRRSLGQDPDHELMALFARSLHELGGHVAAEYAVRSPPWPTPPPAPPSRSPTRSAAGRASPTARPTTDARGPVPQARPDRRRRPEPRRRRDRSPTSTG